MLAKAIELRSFRNTEEERVEFSDGVNVLLGGNAEGKTNLIEAVYLFALGRSFRGAREEEMMRFGSDFASASLFFTDNRRSDLQGLSILMQKGKRRRTEVNGVKINRLSEMMGCFRAVLFCPEHLALIKDGPSLRRGYLDVAISQFRPVYLSSLQKYHNILEHRNKLLKSAEDDRKTFDSMIEIWSEQLAHEAAVIALHREKYIKLVEDRVARCFSDMTGERERTEMRYVGSAGLEGYSDTAETERVYRSLMTSNIEREIRAGSTLWGIHKDDIDISINGRAARLYASQGQQRSLAIAMKLAEGDISLGETGETPVLLLDDVLSELDARRREYLLGEIKDRQVIISTCEEGDYSGARVIRVEKGKYREV